MIMSCKRLEKVVIGNCQQTYVWKANFSQFRNIKDVFSGDQVILPRKAHVKNAFNFYHFRQTLHEVQHGLTQTRERSTELISHYLSPLVQELGKLQANKILRGDYDLKIARQNYFISKQDQVQFVKLI